MAAVPFKVKAVYDYASQEPDDLSFPLGQVITVTEEIDADWYEGEYTDVTGIKKTGIFPNNFVEKYEPEVPSRPTRPSRPNKDVPPAIVSPPPVEPQEQPTQRHATAEEQAPPPPAETKPAATQTSQPREAPAAQKAGPPDVTPETKKPPPVAPKSNAFKDRIAAFNAPAAAPILPVTPGQRKQNDTFIRKPYVAAPPSKDAYIPPPKQENAQKPYVRDEDPEIRQRQEEDIAAAQSAGLLSEDATETGEEQPKPQSLKDRIAMLQRQQLEQAQRRADTGPKKEKTAAAVQAQDDEDAQLEPEYDDERTRPSIEARERPRLPTAPSEPAVPQHEILSGGEEADQSAAGETTEDDAGTIGPDEHDERPLPAPPRGTDAAEAEETAVDNEAEQDDEMDEETRRRLELRERMAKMSGGMGMAGMFGAGMPMPGMTAPKKSSSAREKRSTEDSVASSSPPMPQGRVPMVPIPGLQRVMSPEMVDHGSSQVDQASRQPSLDMGRRSMNETRGAPPPVPQDRPVPPPPATRPSKPPTPPVPGATPLTPGSISDDEAELPTAGTPGAETPVPIRGGSNVSSSVGANQDSQISYFGREASVDRRASRTIQSLPGVAITSPRPPPPPPPTAAPLSPDVGTEDDRGESEYEGDYDTDIASSAKRKDALKGHVREPSLDDSTTADESLASPVSAMPPVPLPPPASRAALPLPPSNAPNPVRQSTDIPRAPPPVPPSRDDDEDYDPYRYSHTARAPPPAPQAAPASTPPVPPKIIEDRHDDSSDDLYAAPAPRKSMDRPPPPPPGQVAPQDRHPLPPPSESQPPRAAPRQSLDVQRTMAMGRRSMEQGRPSGEHGQIANDIELSQSTPWWTAAEPLPPALQGRNGVDLIFECEESITSKRGGRTTVSKDIYILFIDYSQTIITARYDSREPSDVTLEQRHEPAAAKLRQDQLENYWIRFGKHIAETANNLGNAKKETTVGDGLPTSLVHELVKSQQEALLPVGTRAYGALVYANLANASVMQFDEIRAGDIVTLRNAKFEGKHSGIGYQKYKQDLGTSHVAIVSEWDGTKKKVRVWEQGRDEKKAGLRSEAFRLGDLKSGEVRIWRVVGREWVGWESNA